MDRSEFVRRWAQKASEANNPFDRFFAAWIGLIVLSRGMLDEQQLSQPDTDRKAVIGYLEAEAERVVSLLRGLTGVTEWLASRKGTGTGAPIIDVYPASPDHLRGLFDTLAEVWSGRKTRKPRWVANALAELINHIRNHMFHGLKSPDDAADQDLIEHVNPILQALVDRHDG